VQQQAQREGILDVHAYDESGQQYDLEIQVRPQRSYVKRSLYYLARMYGSQLVKSIDYDRALPGNSQTDGGNYFGTIFR